MKISPTLPAPNAELLPGVEWGRPDDFCTPAYWKTQAWLTKASPPKAAKHAIGSTLTEEVGVCLLGGHGMPAEVGLAAFQRLRNRGYLKEGAIPDSATLECELRRPLCVGGRSVRYRFPRQKSEYLATALEVLSRNSPPLDCPLSFRSFFLALPGFGPKTASWLARNWLDTDDVAILDVHIYRAGLIMGLFSPMKSITDGYPILEAALIRFAKALQEPLSALDAIMWRDMRKCSRVALTMLS